MMGNETPRSQAERIACRTEDYPAIAESHPVAGETASGYSCATTSVVIVAPALSRVAVVVKRPAASSPVILKVVLDACGSLAAKLPSPCQRVVNYAMRDIKFSQ